jgi:hypothetical protein
MPVNIERATGGRKDLPMILAVAQNAPFVSSFVPRVVLNKTLRAILRPIYITARDVVSAPVSAGQR